MIFLPTEVLKTSPAGQYFHEPFGHDEGTCGSESDGQIVHSNLSKPGGNLIRDLVDEVVAAKGTLPHDQNVPALIKQCSTDLQVAQNVGAELVLPEILPRRWS